MVDCSTIFNYYSDQSRSTLYVNAGSSLVINYAKYWGALTASCYDPTKTLTIFYGSDLSSTAAADFTTLDAFMTDGAYSLTISPMATTQQTIYKYQARLVIKAATLEARGSEVKIVTSAEITVYVCSSSGVCPTTTAAEQAAAGLSAGCSTATLGPPVGSTTRTDIATSSIGGYLSDMEQRVGSSTIVS